MTARIIGQESYTRAEIDIMTKTDGTITKTPKSDRQLWERVAEGKFGRAENFTFGWGFRIAKAAHIIGHRPMHERGPKVTMLTMYELRKLAYTSGIIRAGKRVR